MSRRKYYGSKNVQDVYIQQRGAGIKIGIAKSVDDRHRTFKTAGPDPIFVIGIIIDGGRETETALHEQFYYCRIKQDNVGTEWFWPHPKLLWWLIINGFMPKPTRSFLWAAGINVVKYILFGDYAFDRR